MLNYAPIYACVYLDPLFFVKLVKLVVSLVSFSAEL